MRLLGGTILMMALVISFVLLMFCAIAEADPSVMGASDQSEDMQILSVCKDDDHCRPAYDRVYGTGAFNRMMKWEPFFDYDSGVYRVPGIGDCDTDTDCAEKFDKMYGAGSADMFDRLMEPCGAAAPLVNCRD